MFDGYEDPVLQMGAAFREDTDTPMDRFGWFYKVRRQKHDIYRNHTIEERHHMVGRRPEDAHRPG